MFMQNFGFVKQRALWYVMVFSGVVDSSCLLSICILAALAMLLGSSTINVIGTNTTNCLQNFLSLAVYEELTGVSLIPKRRNTLNE